MTSQESDEETPVTYDTEVARRVVESNIRQIGENLFAFWTNHQD